mmetsp:Transcript_59937/g.178359  ORF Transcript_59937/g.178359 Transcript_59937/m.178359 type:complete len:204 (-) Transcript_59937:1229-1840(-)
MLHIAEGLPHEVDLARLRPLDVEVPRGHRPPELSRRDVLLGPAQRQADAAHVGGLLLRDGLRLVQRREQLPQVFHRRQGPIVDLVFGEGQPNFLRHVAEGVPHPQPVHHLVLGYRVVPVKVRYHHHVVKVLWRDGLSAVVVTQQLLEFLGLEDAAAVLVVAADDLHGVDLLGVELLPERQPLRSGLPLLRLPQLLHSHIHALG